MSLAQLIEPVSRGIDFSERAVKQDIEYKKNIHVITAIFLNISFALIVR